MRTTKPELGNSNAEVESIETGDDDFLHSFKNLLAMMSVAVYFLRLTSIPEAMGPPLFSSCV